MCEHKFIHLRTENRGIWTNPDSRYVRIIQTEIFFCEKCLESKETKREYSGMYFSRPDWAAKIDIDLY